MSSADAKDISDAGATEDLEEVSNDPNESADGSASNAARRAARQAKAASADTSAVTIPIRLIKRVAAGLLAAVVIAVLAFGGWKLYDQKQELAAFDASKTAGAQFVVTYLKAMSAENATPDSLRKTVGSLTTGDLKARLDSDADDAVKFMQDSKITNLTTSVTSTMVESFDANTADVVVGVDVTGVSPTSGGPAKNALLLQLKVDKVDGEWLVSAMDFGPGVTVGAAQGQPAPAPAPEPVPGG
ncbi:MAG: hypothetical protein WBA38_06430 [Gordonia sp. (in: high G+C Gram-positive bacteria)]|uniref:hypothetical protein n=1 Tax=Gordonia sp. (in: high G+C Gram-positive bacteria) TaxID=84139 RepID=UPI003C731170